MTPLISILMKDWYAMTKRSMVTSVGVLVAGVLVVGCGGKTGEQASASAGPAARTVWDEPDLSGVWKASTKLGATPGQDTFNLTQLEALYRPEARAQMKQMSAKDDPSLRCVPSAFPRALTMGAPIQIVQTPGFATMLTEAIPLHRIIPTNGREHLSEDLRTPYFFGTSTGHWEGDTLVIDVISFNGESWLASSWDKPTSTSIGIWPTSFSMHVVERWRRVDADTLEYQAQVEDPEMLTGAWDTPKVTLKRQQVDRIEEHLCLADDGPSTYLQRLGYSE